MFELMDDISELVYVADPENFDLLYVNNTGRKNFGLKEDFAGIKCYEALQGRTEPCPFCTNSKLSADEIYTWEFTNPLTKNHYLLKDRLIDWDGKMVRLEVAFDITEKENEKVELTNALNAEKMIMECVRYLYREDELDKAIPQALKTLGEYLAADRAYIFEIRDGSMRNTHEWCAPAIEPQIQNLQDIDILLIDRWKPCFDRHECVMIEDLEKIKDEAPEEYKVLHMQGIKSLVAAPLEIGGKLSGYIGVDNPPVEKIKNISSLLQTLRYFLMMTISRINDQKMLVKLSYNDTLTQLHNRNRYVKDIDLLSKGDRSVGVVYLDINGLKDINDQYGHEFGDEILAECAQKARKIFGQDHCYRIGGDEFVIIRAGLTEEQFKALTMELKHEFERDPRCRAAIGCQWTAEPEEIQQIISTADAQMYEDKKRFYHQNRASKRYRHKNDDILDLATPDKLKEELDGNKFLVYLQPKVSTADRSVIGAEALVRYRGKKNVTLPPGQFLPLLEDTRLISGVDYFVCDFVCGKLKEWIDQGNDPFPVSVNFSRYTLAEPGFIERLLHTIEKYDLPKRYLGIEITETVELLDEVDTKELIKKLRQAGFNVYIDDFGTHYANLSLLSGIDFDVLKIDKSLVDDIANNIKTRSLVGSLAELCKKMKINTIAEGIETEEQFKLIKELGVNEAQGFLFSKPMPLEDFEKMYLKLFQDK